MENKQNNKNSFLITWGSCIVFLLVLCFFGISDTIKGTQAKYCQIYNGIEFCTETPVTPGTPSGGVNPSKPSYSSTEKDDDYLPSNSSEPGSNKPSTTKPKKTGDGKYDCSLDWVTCNSDGSYTTTIQGADGSTVTYYHDKKGNFTTSKTEYSDGSYKEYDFSKETYTYISNLGVKVVEYKDGTKSYEYKDGTKKYYNKDGLWLLSIIPNSDGSYRYVVQENCKNNLNNCSITGDEFKIEDFGKIATDSVLFTDNLNLCEQIYGSGKCKEIDGSYVSTDKIDKIGYYTEENCKKYTGKACQQNTFSGKTVWIATDCEKCKDGCPTAPLKCESGYIDNGSGECIKVCSDGSIPNKNGDCPSPISIPKDDTDRNPTTPPSSSSSKPNDRGKGCYKNNDTGSFKWFESDPELKSNTKLYEKVNDSNCQSNVTENPQTGEIAMFLIWMIAFSTVGYSVWYYIKSRKEN